ncbi:hypothetical protein M407DRAFT_19180 [Tulasnella calospora MUT 4182]|uniref:F-box domain-containing protein n=1 Tax=Tulasnella calospora MUT 4182 TaxID=1051891 RepID=A0A0C3LDB8_9AGAM|nr:hypothetical protein M407DRAFT_19180 [Tulasnella calospora MUT 4182]
MAEIPPEILMSIFEWGQCHKDLLSFALVCRSWTEWAIDARWRVCEVPLLEILTILDLTKRSNPDVDDDADWTKFVAISNKVTKVKCNFILPTEAAINFYERCKQHDDDALFQNVWELIVYMDFTDYQTTSIVCSPGAPKSIRMYVLGVIARDTADYSWLCQAIPRLSLAACAPSVESILVAYVFARDGPSLSRFAQLRVLECHLSSITLTWWEDLATCPKLTDLRLRYAVDVEEQRGWQAPRSWPGANVVVFPMLEIFHHTIKSKRVVPFVVKSSFPVLRHLVLYPCPDPEQVECITAHLRNCSPLLREFRSAADYVAEE